MSKPRKKAAPPPLRVVVAPGLDPDTVAAALAESDVVADLIVGSPDESALSDGHAVLVVACRGYSDELRLLVERAVRAAPGRPLLIVSWSKTSSFLRQLVALGANEILLMPADAARLSQVCESALGQGPEPSAAELVAVVGAKGGTGKTLTAVNLAVALARRGKKVALVDTDLQFGDVGITLGLEPERTLYDLASQSGRLDEDKLGAFLVPHPSGVDVLLAPARPEQADAVSGEMLGEAWRLLGQTHDYIILDTCPGLSPEVLALIDASTYLCVVGALDVSSLKDTRLGLETLERLAYDMARVCLVLNRVRPGLGLGLSEATAILGQEPAITISDDISIARASNLGRPVALDDGELSAPFIKLASWFLGEAEQPAASRWRRWSRSPAPSYEVQP